MPIRYVPRLIDHTYRAAWWRFLRRWQPMALWTMLVWLLFGLALVPLSSAVLGAAVFRGDRIVVANVDLLAWLLTPVGAMYLLTAGALGITAGVVRYAGLFRIITDDMEKSEVSVRQTLLEILPDLPALFKVCVFTVMGAAALLIPLLLGAGVIYLALLGEHDINYYIFAEPPEWRRALVAGGIWGAVWLAGAVWVVLHTIPALPAYLDGHRPLRRAVREAWRRTRGSAMRVIWLFFLSVVGWLAIRAGAQGAFYGTAGWLITVVERMTDALAVTVLATAAYALGSLLLDAAISFVGFSFAATVLTKFYHERTDLHRRAPAVPPGWRKLPGDAVAIVRHWFRPARLAVLVLIVLTATGGMTALVITQLPPEREVVITAHRAGALLAPENTLAALERAIEAGAHFAEIDVQRTRDGEVIVIHDADFMRVTSDPRRVAAVDFAEIAHLVQGDDPAIPPEERRIATLDEFIERSRGRIGLNIELKYYGPDPALADSVVAKVHRWGVEGEVVFMSIELEAVRQLQRQAPDVPVGYVAAFAAGDLGRLPVDFLAVSRPIATNPLVRSASRRGVEVHVWTLNSAAPIFEVLERGVDGIITDDPILARRVVGEFAALTRIERLLLRMRRTVFDLESSNADDRAGILERG